MRLGQRERDDLPMISIGIAIPEQFLREIYAPRD
jgi:hypothetical protein